MNEHLKIVDEIEDGEPGSMNVNSTYYKGQVLGFWYEGGAHWGIVIAREHASVLLRSGNTIYEVHYEQLYELTKEDGKLDSY